MKKINYLFSFFFLFFLLACSVLMFCQTLDALKHYGCQYYDFLMKKRYTMYDRSFKRINGTLKDRGKRGIVKTQSPLSRKIVNPQEKKHSRRLKKFSALVESLGQGVKSIRQMQDLFEKQLVKSFPFRYVFSEISMAFRKFIGMKRPIENSRHYLRQDDTLGLLPVPLDKSYNLEDIVTAAKAAGSVNAKFLLVVRPENSNSAAEIWPGLQECADPLVDQRIMQIKKFGIPVFDMRPSWNKLPNRRSLFFRTDHHWNVYGALKGVQILASMLKDKYDFDYDLNRFAPELFEKISLKNIFLGSSGKALSLEYVKDFKLDDFDILLPSGKTDFSFSYFHYNSDKHYDRGDFSVFFFKKHWKYKPYYSNPYNIWLNGDRSEIRIINHKISPNRGKKLIFIKDSFSNSMVPYLALQTRTIIMLDPRFCSRKRINEVIRQEKPDVVIWNYSLISPAFDENGSPPLWLTLSASN